MFTLPRKCVLPVLLAAPQQGALPVCALVTLALVGSTKLMSHCHVWVSVICTGCMFSISFWSGESSHLCSHCEIYTVEL